MSVYEKIIQLLNSSHIEYRALEHEPTPTCADSARVRGTSMDQGAKALVCFADKKPILIVLPCSHKLDTRSFKSEFNVKDLRFATPEEVLQLTQLQIGAIPPFGKLFEIPTYVDENLSANENIAFNAGDRCKSIIMRYKDYIEASGGIIGRYAAK
ncbi:MAG: YbaK/EbsC family protein [Patescibacteria group bacterium]